MNTRWARRVLRRPALDEEGGITIEFVLWLPFIIGIISLVVDITLILNGYSQISRVVQDSNRRLATATVPDVAATQANLQATVRTFAKSATATLTVVDDVVYTDVAVPTSELSFTQFFPGLTNVTIHVGGVHLLEKSPS